MRQQLAYIALGVLAFMGIMLVCIVALQEFDSHAGDEGGYTSTSRPIAPAGDDD